MAGELSVQQRWALVTPHREHMLAVARRRCASPEDAEDCAHEAMLRVAQFESLDPARVEALLTSITTRLAVDLHRVRTRERRYQPRLVHVPEQQAPPDEAALDADEARWLAAQVSLLPDRERAVFEQRAAGYSATETAARLRLSYKSVESAFTRARSRMRWWAGGAVLLVAEYLRRLRQRTAAVWTSAAMVSAGYLILSSLHGSAPQTGTGPQMPPAARLITEVDRAGPAAPSRALAAASTLRQLRTPLPAGRPAAATTAAPPTTGFPSHQVLTTGSIDVLGITSVSVTWTQYDVPGGYADHAATCVDRGPSLDTQSGAVCPPR
jgi:RNA polymerase sigma-70 factor (ECF subfamily)